MLLSRGCEYALRAVLFLASQDEEGFVPIRRISDRLDVEFHFLTKLFQQLTEAGLAHSQRGPRGGIALARAPGRITLLDVVFAIDGPKLFTECVLGLPGCGEEKPCPMHDGWAVERERLKALFMNTSLADMADEMRKADFRISPLPA